MEELILQALRELAMATGKPAVLEAAIPLLQGSFQNGEFLSVVLKVAIGGTTTYKFLRLISGKNGIQRDQSDLFGNN